VAGGSSGARGVSLATQQQKERYIFSFGHQCWNEQALPLLGPDRCGILHFTLYPIPTFHCFSTVFRQ
jgi:hypothetical protein